MGHARCQHTRRGHDQIHASKAGKSLHHLEYAAEYLLDDIALRFEDAIVQPGDRIKGRQNGSLLPCRNAGGVLAGQNDSAVDLAKVVVVLRSGFVAPVAGASQCKGYAVPRHGNAVLEFAPVLRVKVAAEFDGAGYSFGR
jgi:hypothetical protein